MNTDMKVSRNFQVSFAKDVVKVSFLGIFIALKKFRGFTSSTPLKSNTMACYASKIV